LDSDELKLVLARAFDRAWVRYYQPGRVTIPPDIARPALANQLVKMAKDGVTDESKLAAGGVLHLVSLTPEEPGDVST
jgi:hypothetical protein